MPSPRDASPPTGPAGAWPPLRVVGDGQDAAAPDAAGEDHAGPEPTAGRPGPLSRRPQEPPGPLGAEAAFRQYAGYVAAIAHRLLGRDDEVDDVVQEVFLAAVNGLGRLQTQAALKGWLATVTVRIAGRRLRLRRLRGFLGFDDVRGYEELAAPGTSPEDRAMVARLYALLDELPVKQRLAWTLRYLEGEPLENVARLCRCSLATAKRRISAAHQVIERVLSDD